MFYRNPGPVLPLLLLAAGLAVAQDAEPPADAPRLGGRLALIDHERQELVGDVWADLPLFDAGPGRVYTAWDLRSAISGTSSDFALTVDNVQYAVDVGYRWRLGARGPSLAVFSGVRGRDAVDRPGSVWVGHAGVAFESRDYGRIGSAGDALERVSWTLGAASVLERSGVEADAVVRGAARTRLLGERLTFDVEADALVDGGRWGVETSIGPSIGLPLEGGRRMALFVRHLDGGNPLGIRGDGWLAGFEYVEGPPGYLQASRGGPVGIDGSLSIGAGDDDRESAQLYLRFLTPELSDDVRIAFALDTNLLTGPLTNELYYLYDVGLERVLRDRPRTGEPRSVVGAYFYHRSNHQLGATGPVTSLNVVEAGIETPHWQTRHDVRRGRLGALEGRLRVGWLLESDFGEDRRWHARGGLHWRMPFGKNVVPFVRVEAETGDLNRRIVGVGVLTRGFEFQVERRTDDQYFGTPREATLATAGYVF